MKIALICPFYFNYHNVIKSELIEQGHDVILFNEIPNPNIFKIIKNISSEIGDCWVRNYYTNIGKAIVDKKVDKIILIRGHVTPVLFIKTMNEHGIKTVMYQWDSLRNNSYAHLIPYCERVFTFDRQDSKDLEICYLPLFYSNIPDDNIDSKVDVLFVGSLHGRRLEVFKDLSSSNTELSFKVHFYISFLAFVKSKLLGRVKAKTTEVSFSKLPYSDYLSLLSVSKSVLDMPSQSQDGASIRVIEALANHRKVITTDKGIVNDEFFSDKNILVLGESENANIKSFIESEYDKSFDFTPYSIKNWVNTVVNYGK